MNEKEKKFREEIKWPVDYSKIDFKQYQKLGNNGDSDPAKNDRQKFRGGENHSRERKKNSGDFNESCSSSAKKSFKLEKLFGEKYNIFVKKIIDLESDYLDIIPPDFLFYQDYSEDADFGFYSPSNNTELLDNDDILPREANTIYLNQAMPLLTDYDYEQFITTLLHEIRHKYQDEAINNPEKYVELNEKINSYFCDAREHYDKDAESSDMVRKNGLEVDAEAYAMSRAKIYTELSIDEILALEKAPIKSVKNSILMEPGYLFNSGQRAPLTTGANYFTNGYNNIHIKNGKKSQQGKELQFKKGGNMEMAGGIDFSPRAQEEAAKVYGNLIENIQSFSEKAIEYFVERVKTHPYKQLEAAGNVFIEYYNDSLPKAIKAAINEWISSDNSFTASLRAVYADDEESKSAALRTEERLIEKVDTCFKDIQPIRINRSVSVVEQHVIIEDANFMINLSKQLEDMKNTWMERFAKYGEEVNSLYATMMSMVASTFTNVESCYQATYKDIMEISQAFNLAIKILVTTHQDVGMTVAKTPIDNNDNFTSARKHRH